MRTLLHEFDEKVSGMITSLPIFLHQFFIFITTLGDPLVTIGIGGAVALWGYLGANTRLLISGTVVWITLIIGLILKILFGRARPLTEYAANIRVDAFSFPSGHASGSIIAYGLLAYIAWQVLPQPWSSIVVVALIALIILIGISRIYLGAHFPSDVIAGWLLGGVVLAMVIFVITPILGK